jgi:hypothetical protein
MGTTNPDYHRKLHREQRDDKRIPVRLDLRVGVRLFLQLPQLLASRELEIASRKRIFNLIRASYLAVVLPAISAKEIDVR